MKIKNIITSAFVASLILMFACEDHTDLTGPGPVDTGDIDFTSYVAIGNSLTAGFQNNALYENSQVLSFGKIIAGQVGTSFQFPNISEPGIAGRLEVSEIESSNGQIENIIIVPNSGVGQPTNLDHAAPYNNLGIPGAILFDLIDETDFAQKSAARNNPFFSIVLRDAAFGSNVVQQALNLQPTFITLWIGNNDVLGYATSGGTQGTDLTGTQPTDPATFAFLYNEVATALADTSGYRKVAAANIPDVASIPYFTTVGPQMAAGLEALGVPAMVYQRNGETIGTGVATPDNLKTGDILITLTGSSTAGLLGDTSGKYYSDNNIPVPDTIDTSKPFGFDSQNPWPDVFTLDADEIGITIAATNSFNGTISGIVGTYSESWVLVDINSFFNEMKEAEESVGGMMIDGINFTTEYVSGNAFSLDGVHPTTQGYAIVANEFFNALNKKFDSNIPTVNVSTYPGSLPLVKSSGTAKRRNYSVEYGALDLYIF